MQAQSPARAAIAHAVAGRDADAVATLAPALAVGDAEALYVDGLWRVEGRLVPRDLAAARRRFGDAAGKGHAAAARTLAAFLAAGVGGPRDWAAAVAMLRDGAPHDPIAARQYALIRAMTLTADGASNGRYTVEPLSDAPYIACHRALFTHDECALLIDLAATRFKPATIYHEAHKRFVLDPVRQSDTAGFPMIAEPPFVHALNRRIAAATDTDVAQGETLQVLRYGAGQQYRPHLDAIPGLANQRVLTALVYLDDGYDGGDTVFEAAGVRFRGGIGDALVFANVDAAGRPDPATRHAGAPVTRGVKTIASRWIRATPAEGFDARV